MQGTVLYGPGDIRVEQCDDPKITVPTRCGNPGLRGLRPYRGIEAIDGPMPMGHEYVGNVEETGSEVRNIKPGQFLVGSFFTSDNTCPICRVGYQSACVHREYVGAGGTQAEQLWVPLADGNLVAVPGMPADDLVPSLLAASDVLGTGWFGAVAAEAGPGKTVAVVGDGAVDLLAVLAVRQLSAEQVIAMSRHEARQKLARNFGASLSVSTPRQRRYSHVFYGRVLVQAVHLSTEEPACDIDSSPRRWPPEPHSPCSPATPWRRRRPGR